LIIVPLTLQLVGVMAVVAYLLGHSDQSTIDRLGDRVMAEENALVVQKLQTYVEAPARINRANADAVRLGELDPKNLDALSRHLIAQLQQNEVSSIQFGNPQGEFRVARSLHGDLQVVESDRKNSARWILYSTNSAGQKDQRIDTIDLSTTTLRDRPWYGAALGLEKPTQNPAFFLGSSEALALCSTHPIYDQNNKLLGVFAVTLNLEGISEVLNQLVINQANNHSGNPVSNPVSNQPGQVFVLDRAGNLIGNSSQEMPLKSSGTVNPSGFTQLNLNNSSNPVAQQLEKALKKKFSHLDQIQEAQKLNFEVNQISYVAALLPFKHGAGLNWIVVTILPTSDLGASVQQFSPIAIGFALLALASALGLGTLAVFWVTRPSRFLGQIGQAIAAARPEPNLPESDRLFRLAVQHAPDIFVLYDRDRRIQYINDQGLKKTGWSLEQCLGQRDEDLLPPEVANSFLPLLQAALETKTLQSGECTLQLPGSEAATLIVKYVPLLTPQGEVDRVFSITCDITDRKRVEAALRDSEQQLRLLADSLPALISYVDSEECYRFANKTYETFFGISRELIPGKRLIEVVGDAYYDQIKGYIKRARAGEMVSYEATMPGEKPRHLSVNLAPNIDQNSQVQGFYVLAIDISDRKQLETDLQRSQEAATVANRTKSAFLSSMSHELRTPLNAILGFSQLLSQERTLSRSQHDQVSTILRSGEHLLALINDVLEMSKIDAGRMSLNLEDFDLHQFLEDLVPNLRRKAEEKGLQLQLQQAANLPQVVHSDRVKLRQILVNLLGNAIKFTQDGQIGLRVWVNSGANSEANFEEPPPNIVLVLEVEDTGIGIAADELERIFEPFVQAEASLEFQQGTGLGLTLSRRYAQLLGGKLTASSQVDRGSQFRLDLPMLPGRSPHQMPSSERWVGWRSPQTCRLLVVEDHPDSRDLVVVLLSNLGIEVRTASNGQEAIELWQSWSPQVILMDMQMPVLNGYETTRQIRALEQKNPPPSPVPIIALTASVFEEQQAEILAAGCNTIVCKPFKAETLYQTIAQYSGSPLIAKNNEPAQPSDPDLSQTPTSPIQPADLAVLPLAWRREFHYAATRLFEQKCHELVAQIPAEHAHLRPPLDLLIQEFRFDRLIELTRD
jgi:PAS domain S-box-containing protein